MWLVFITCEWLVFAMLSVGHVVKYILPLLCIFQVSCKPFNVYWNIPTITCKNLFNISFANVDLMYGITINQGDEFRGDKVSILYTPGLVPQIRNYTHKNYTDDDYKYLEFINGGVPQNADFVKHLDAFKEHVDKHVPIRQNKGLIIIDVEEWGATWAQNFNNMEIHRIISRKLVRDKNPTMTKQEVEDTAHLIYERAALAFLVRTLQYGQALRPQARWGYYQYPQCFNQPGEHECSEATKNDNNQMIQLWRRSNALFPSLYLSNASTPNDRAIQIRGMIQEAHRVTTTTTESSLVIPYISTRYFYGNNIIYRDLENLIKIAKDEGADGVVIWGAYLDYNTHEKCTSFHDYVSYVLGPTARKFITKT
uniref:Hyaluronidase n=1 Tax=Clastoptera arizonana TaxID=38151 RepID=A0A1B6DIB0_9HEMI